jgi:iron complex transport system substrate-binding protein
LVLALALIGGAAAVGLLVLQRQGESGAAAATPDAPLRIVSLAPAVTETLFAIGAGGYVVGRTQYCDYPPEVEKLPSVGTTLTPQYENMSRLEPTLIVGEATKDAPVAELERIAPTRLLPWLALDDICAGIRELGRLTGRFEAADALAARLKTQLDVAPPAGGPRVLLAMDATPGKLDEVFFLRQNSLHGACLNAAGARNAVPEAIVGVTPVLSLERVIAIDPDMVIVLAAQSIGPSERRRVLEDWQRLSMLSAVKNGKVRVLDGREFYVNGPRIVELVDRLRAALGAK